MITDLPNLDIYNLSMNHLTNTSGLGNATNLRELYLKYAKYGCNAYLLLLGQ